MTTICKICGNSFIEKFSGNTCCSKKCGLINYKLYKKNYNFKNKNKLNLKAKRYYSLNKVKFHVAYKSYYKKNRLIVINRVKNYAKNNSDKLQKYKKNYKLVNRKRLNLLNKVRYDTDVLFKLRQRMSSRLRDILKHRGVDKRARATEKLLGYNSKELKEHLEKQFTNDMSWFNYGSYWHIDHKIPISYGSNFEEILELSKLDNLQPLEKKHNLSKRNFYISNLFGLDGDCL
jgi:hypothetical protein